MSLPSHQQDVRDRILELRKSMDKHDTRSNQDLIMDAIISLEPAKFWDEIDNESEAQGVIKLLGWIQSYLEG